MTTPVLPASIKAFKGAKKALQLAPLDMAVLVGRADRVASFTRNIEGPDNKPAIPTGIAGVGYLAKDTSIGVKFDISSNDIDSAGEGLPTRIIIDRQSIEFDFEMRQTGRQALELQFSADYSAVTPTAVTGGIHAPIATVPENQDYRAIILGKDSYQAKPIYFGYVLNMVQVSNVDNQKWDQKNTLLWHPTLKTIADDEDLENLGEFFIFGEGFKALSAVTDTGFAPPPVEWIDITPPSSALSLSLAAGATAQLAVHDNNGANRTAAATYVSSATSKATVSPTGKVTPVAVGTSDITASFSGKSDTVTVTVVA
ncbi:MULTISPECIES: Ig-like domain-containing protein [Mycobacteroides]|uniref:Ig-like domain-containing protein n=1 Tax=Mycobacteroides TaxID=670516 RepID=UPI0005DC7B70|nr:MULTISPECIES: Ig-like domain-containing protein [Mycobacteroides]CPR84585.1 Bacterial Ig-like domain (group 2) [Mycobacteroides abscessus]CPS03272.1 Bacterial Ig-like domain (group 2) [Mycobacteroides abscessus]CPT04370.1 Bacterial Ig-like domain (group 2) [Mycobacteroides abscessus]CPU33542.1 Bacterial Ig-like domain (group 2) [Mycobacteroides abscessus]CPV12115.1 Bacterial Ig-like domain (group 2) [Mycobacteroides abscessus]